MIKVLLWIVLALVLAGVGGLFFLAQNSKTGAPPGLANGRLTPCPSSPNCVSSEAGTDAAHFVEPLPLESWDRLTDVIDQQGGRVVALQPDYVGAVFTSKLMGFVDDVEFRKGDDGVHVRSASRVGHSDMGVNAKRVEALRAALKE